ncbi:MAG: T9SS type A sorting domain-containing protein [Bacteroidales bacterium]|nr:T9SS type A sorting domain-containing protein [Bacteroidales bacterium]
MKNLTRNLLGLYLLLLPWTYRADAQERLLHMPHNPQLRKMAPVLQQKSGETANLTPLQLPFTEDFSGVCGYPDTARWTDRSAFVNQHFGFRPPSIGVATLDAVDALGRVYPQGKTTAFPADTLTSRPIRTDSLFRPVARALTASDSLYFSFFYQPGGGIRNHPWEGLGDAPEASDSLILEFGFYTGDSVYTEDSSAKVPETRWVSVWSSGGTTLEQFVAKHHLDSSLCFRQVMIPVTDSCFFNPGFQFRFRNLASLEFTKENPTWAGNVDFWNIDYIRLDRGRSCKDTFIDDIALADNPGGLLKNYTAMPWSHFQASELKTAFEVHLLNLSNVTKNASYIYRITNPEGQTAGSYDGGSYNIEPLRSGGFQSYAPHARPDLRNLSLTSAADTVDFRILHLHREAGSGDLNPFNDTVVFMQPFRNYFAYDDGTPEAGYTVVDVDTYKTALALKFSMGKADTLRAIAMYINHVLDEANDFDFTLSVWNDRNDMPGELMYSQKVSQHYSDALYDFQLFYLDRPIALQGTYYVGYQISNKNFLNVGFDQNTNRSENVRYFSGNQWHTSFLAGTPMIRPYVGNPWSPVAAPAISAAAQGLKVYPNPVEDRLHIALPESMRENTTRLQVCNLSGQVLYQGAYTSELSTENLPAGLYLLKADDGKQRMHCKFVVR